MKKSNSIAVINPASELTSEFYPELGKQITAQHERATGGMREIIIFGSMLLGLREHLLASHAEPKRGGRGRYQKESGMKTWLRQFTPKISEPSAYRFMRVTESIFNAYQLEHGSKAGEQCEMLKLAITPAKELPKSALAIQSKLFEFASGSSQRSWLGRFKPSRKAAIISESPMQKVLEKKAIKLLTNLYSNLGASRNSFGNVLLSLPVLADDSKNGNAPGLVQFRQMLDSLTALVDKAIEAKKDTVDSEEH